MAPPPGSATARMPRPAQLTALKIQSVPIWSHNFWRDSIIPKSDLPKSPSRTLTWNGCSAVNFFKLTANASWPPVTTGKCDATSNSRGLSLSLHVQGIMCTGGKRFLLLLGSHGSRIAWEKPNETSYARTCFDEILIALGFWMLSAGW